MKIDRLLSIVVLLLNRRKITAKELSEKFEVSLRTIYRDIDSINASGIPVIPYQGYQGGYCIMDNYKLSKQLLTLDDMIAILSSLNSINDAFTNKKLENAIDKITSVVPENRAEKVERHLEQFAIDVLPWGVSEKNKETIGLMNQAIESSQIIQFDYCNQKGEITNRSIEPMTIVFKGYGWYLFGYCLEKKDFRVFKIARMKEILLCDKHFERKKVSYQGYFSFDSGSPVLLKLLFKKSSKNRIYESFEHDQISVLENGDFIITIEFPDTPWIYTFLLGYGSEVEVLEPLYIRERLIEEIKKMTFLYKN